MSWSRAVASCAAVVGLFAINAAAASAVPATWNVASPSGAVVSGTLSVTNGSQTTSCALSIPSLAGNYGSPAQARLVPNNPAPAAAVTCANGKQFSLNLVVNGNKTGSAYSLVQSGPIGGYSPVGPFNINHYEGATYALPFVNGVGATPSKVTFTNTYIGPIYGGGALYATGSLNVTKTGGALLTLL